MVSIDTIIIYMNRPSHKELSRKISIANKCITSGNINLINAKSIIFDAIELGYSISTDLNEILKDIIENLSADDYIGYRPPQKSYERAIEGLELFEFTARCSRFTDRIYLKFSIQEPNFFLVSLHPHRK